MRKGECRPLCCEELDRRRDPILLRLLQFGPPTAELVSIFDLPGHAPIYSFDGIRSIQNLIPNRLEITAPKPGTAMALVVGADAVFGARTGIGGTETGQPFQCVFQIGRIVAKMRASAAGGGRLPAHRVKFCQCAANTTAESSKPNTTFTPTPALKAANGRQPAWARARKRVVRPMLRKQKMKAQLRKSLIGATRAGVIAWP